MVESRVVPRTLSGMSFPASRPHHRLGVEQVHMRRPAPLPEDDDALGLRGEMGQARQPGLARRPVGARARSRSPGATPGPPSRPRSPPSRTTGGGSRGRYSHDEGRSCDRFSSHSVRKQVTHSRVRASSRFRIARQTAESAACSATSSVSSRFDSPTARSAFAPPRRPSRRSPPACRRRDAGP